MIRVNGVHIGYSSPLLQVQNMELKTGELYILIGKNGSGKSTFLKSLSGQIPVLQGELLVKDKAIGQISNAEIPQIIAFVGAHFPVMDYMRVKEFVGLARSPYTNFFGALKDNDQRIIEQALEQLNIAYLADRFTSTLSDGERQMVAIAKAVAQNTSVILLDEPTAFLDYANKKNVLDQLTKTAKALNKCIILSSHDIELSLDSASSFLVVNNTNKEIELLDASTTKEELLQRAFNLKL